MRYLLPSLAFFLVAGCARQPPPNKVQPMPSPSGAYVLTMPIGDHPRYADTPAWIVTITAVSGNIEYRDDDSDFIGTLNVYWFWDEEDHVWLYNSDDGGVWFWERVDGQWIKTCWGQGKDREIDCDLTPPLEVYPPYAR